MPNINKVVYGDRTLIDLSTTTLSQASQLANGVTAYDRAGNVITGTASGGGATPYVLITGEQDAGGGKIVHITGAVNETITADSGGGDIDAMSATVLLDLSDDTVDAAHLISGYTAHNSMGQPITGTAVAGEAVLGTKTISSNGTYNASTDSLDGYSSVTVNVPTGTTPTGTKSISISSNGTTTEDVTSYASAEITVNVPNSYAASDEGKVVSSGALVSQTSDSVTSNGTVDTTTINSLSINVPTGTARTSADLTASGATVTVPAGLYTEAASKSVASGSASTPATTITANPSISVSSSGLITASVSGSKSVTPSVSAGYVSSGTAGTVSVSGSNTEQLTTMAAQTVTPSASSQTVQTSGKYMTGNVTVNPIPSQYIVPSGSETKTTNGTYDVTSLAEIVVDVPTGGGVNIDTKTVTASNYPVSISFSSMQGEPKAFFLCSTSQMSSSGSTTYYYIVDMRYNGTNTTGNCFRIGSTRRVDNITSGYSWSYSGTTLTITSSASSRSASPGAFNNGYELVYIY